MKSHLFDHESEFKNISWERKPFKCQRAVQWFSFAWGVGGKRGAEVRGHGVTGCGKHGASVKNTSKPLFHSMNFPHHHEKSKFVISNWKENQLAWNAFLDHESALTISGEKKNIQMPACVVQWLLFECGGYFIFHSDLRRPCFNLKKNVNTKDCFA